MPAPFIPPELIADILSHFHFVDDSDTENDARTIEAVGKSASLVCRSWRPLGQALPWRTISLNIFAASSLLDHLVSYPHITSFVLEAKISSPFPLSREEADEQRKHYAPTTEILSKFSVLRLVDLNLPVCPDLAGFLLPCSKLPNLRRLSVCGGELCITPALKTAFFEGFPVLESLTLAPTQLTQPLDSFPTETQAEEEDGVVGASSRKSQLRKVGLVTQFIATEEVALSTYEIVRSAFDWSRVDTCAIGGCFLETRILFHLACQSHLARLRLFPLNQDLASLYMTIYALLPDMTNLRSCEVESNKEEDDILETPIEISKFLRRIPINLGFLKLPQIAFDPMDRYGFPSVWTWKRRGKKAHRVFMTLASAGRPLILYEYDFDGERHWCL
ncbi:uncharacterized protein JCM6883_003889 [Sporobolomyces salmoneus]|uniref:uncharacterized protein n=1 Tax=Sporobolomyces salmoneus TaxID=183962 RepID=UPI0031786828